MPDWRDSFVAVTRQAFADDAFSFDDASAALRNASGKHLLEFDHRARWSFSHYLRHAGNKSSAVLRVALTDPKDADLFLFYGSCDGNGYIREQALRALRGHDGRLACAAALIRTGDWVPEVAEIASQLLQSFAAADSGRHFFGLLDLISTLQSRVRFKLHFTTTLEPFLLAPKWREHRHAALSNTKAVARRMAHDLALRADPDAAAASLRRAIADPTGLVALWALARLRDTLDAQEIQVLLREGLRSRLALVRSDSLRRYCRTGFIDVRETLEAALFDRARSVRGVAAYQLTAMYSESALDCWRRAFDEGRREDAIIAALSDFGETADETRLRSFLMHPRGRVRALALRALARIGAADTEALLANGLRDGSVHVVGAVIATYAHGIGSLTIENLHRAVASTESPTLRLRLISASRWLGKWARLEFLLAQYSSCRSSEFDHLDRAVCGWIANANSSYAVAGTDRRNAIALALETARTLHPSRQWSQVLHML